MTEYVYMMRERPPAPGALPRLGLLWVYDGEINTASGHCWGKAAYDRPLTKDEMEHYSMEFCNARVLQKTEE